MNLQHIDPVPQLKSYIEKIWVFESNGPMPSDDMKLIVPNGRLLLVIPFRNSLTGKMGGKYYIAKTNRIAVTGMCDLATIVDTERFAPVGTIGVEINAIGAYRFFHLRLKDIKNQLHYLTDILGKIAREIELRIAESQSIDEKINFIQQFLLSLFTRKEEDRLFEYCIQRIMSKSGSIKIGELEKETGYSSRWLNMKFEEKLGISPKNLGSLMRFHQYYHALILNSVDFFNEKKFFNDYHDESHFIKDFKRFTGLPPSKLIRSKNDFGGMFYQD